MFNFRKNLSEKLGLSIKKAMETLDSPIFFGHIFLGKLSDEGSVRITEIKINDKKEKSGLFHQQNTDTGFTKHINRVGRKNTFADFLHLLFYKDQEVDESYKIFICHIRNNLSEKPINYNVSGNEHLFEVSTEFAELLVPSDLIMEYVNNFLIQKATEPNLIVDEEILSDEEIAKEYITEKFLSCKSLALKFLESNNAIDALERISQPYGYKDSDFNKLNFLSAFQTALLYRAVFVEGEAEEVGFISLAHSFKINTLSKLAFDHPIILVSSIFTDLNDKENIIETQKQATSEIKAEVWDAANKRIVEINTQVEVLQQHFPRIPDFRKFYEMIEDYTKKQLKIRFQPEWAVNITVWNAYLIEKLRNSVHEGRNLSFTFVTGDVSEVRDSNLFEIHELIFFDTDKSVFHPWKEVEGKIIIPTDSDNFLENVFKTARQTIEKKNYSWFSEGRYALLWDTSFPSKFPHSLIRVKNSSWDVVINDIRNNRGSEISKKVSLMINFVRYDQSGGLIIDDKLVASFSKSEGWKYITSQTDRKEEELRKTIKDALMSWEEISPSDKIDLENIFLKSVMAVSDDPNIGCMLIIGKNIKDIFNSMGHPWRTRGIFQNDESAEINPKDLTIDEMTSLMAMDGATCLYIFDDKPAISFRNSVMTTMGEGKNIDKAKEELDGEGSRKWSALIASTIDEVDVVIAVSQDGPIYIYKANDENEIIPQKLV